MRTLRLLLAIAVALPLWCQTKITIPAGTPEDKALTEISQQPDQEKRISMLEDFLKQYAGNPQAVAYGNWQLSQQYVSSDPAKALEYGDKALAAMPNVLDILQTQTDLAQQLKDCAKTLDYAARGGVVIDEIAKQPKPDGMSNDDYTASLAAQKAALAPIYDYLAAAAYNAIATEPDPKKRIKEIERFSEVFQNSKLMDNANALAIETYTELNDMPRLTAYGDKALAADPKNASLLTLLANAFAEDPKGANLAKAEAYSRQAIELMKTDTSPPTEGRTIREGFAYQILGYTLLREDKTLAAIAQLKTASTMLKEDAPKYSITLYRLGYAYAKNKQNIDAKQVLSEAVKVPGPFQEEAKKLLAQVNAAHPAGR